MSDNKNGCKPKDASILDYYHKLSPYRMINQIADSIKQTVGAAEDLMQNRSDMAADRTIGNDKYFHCKGNCEATRRGPVSEFASTIMSDAREYYQTHIKRPPDKIKDSEEDEEANKYGRENAYTATSCRQVCQGYRVKGINKKY